MRRPIPSFLIPFSIVATLVVSTQGSEPQSPLGPTTLSSERLVPVDQVILLSDPGVALIRPSDGRLRGYGFSAVITGVAAVDSVGTNSTAMSAGLHRHLVVFSLALTQYFAPAALGDGTAPSLTANVAFDGGYLPIDVDKLRANGQATYVVSVPNRRSEIDLEMTAANFTSSFSLTALHRVGEQPAVLYRDPTQPNLTVNVGQNVPVPVEAPTNAFSSEEILGVKSAILTDFEPGDPSVQPSNPNEAYLAIVGSDTADPDPPPGYLPGAHFVDGFSAVAPSALTLTLPDGVTAAGAHSGPSADGLLSGTYYFVVPADTTSASLSVAPGTVSGVVYDNFTGLTDSITFPQPATFTMSLPPVPSAPIVSTSTSTLPVVDNNPASAVVRGAVPTAGADWLDAVEAAGAAGILGAVILVSRRRSRHRRSGAKSAPAPYRPLVPLGVGAHVEAASVLRSSPVFALPPGPRTAPREPRMHGYRSPKISPPTPPGSTTEAPLLRVTQDDARHGSPRTNGASRTIELLILGPVEVRGWRRRPRRRIVTALLCYLALHPERPVSGDQILSALWPLGSIRKEATRASLHTYVSDLRRALPDGMVPDAASADGYTLTRGIPTDWGTFVALLPIPRRLAERCGTTAGPGSFLGAGCPVRRLHH